jgi:hypothetical protein
MLNAVAVLGVGTVGQDAGGSATLRKAARGIGVAAERRSAATSRPPGRIGARGACEEPVREQHHRDHPQD